METLDDCAGSKIPFGTPALYSVEYVVFGLRGNRILWLPTGIGVASLYLPCYNARVLDSESAASKAVRLVNATNRSAEGPHHA
jgi:hypothetical protein